MEQHSNESQCKILLKWLQSGRTITSLGAIKKWLILRLASRVFELKKAGHNIESERIEINGKHFAKYRLKKK